MLPQNISICPTKCRIRNDRFQTFCSSPTMTRQLVFSHIIMSSKSLPFCIGSLILSSTENYKLHRGNFASSISWYPLRSSYPQPRHLLHSMNTFFLGFRLASNLLNIPGALRCFKVYLNLVIRCQETTNLLHKLKLVL